MGIDKHESNAKLRRPRQSNETSGVADWESANPGVLVKVLARAGKKQCALRFGYSRDGGAYAIGVYTGSEYWTDYVRPSEDIDQYLQDLLLSLEEYEVGFAPSIIPQRGKKK